MPITVITINSVIPWAQWIEIPVVIFAVYTRSRKYPAAGVSGPRSPLRTGPRLHPTDSIRVLTGHDCYSSRIASIGSRTGLMSLDPEVQAHTPVEREGTDGVKKSQAGTKRTVDALAAPTG